MKSGLRLAFALTDYEVDMSKRIESPRSIYLQAEMRSWYVPENSINGVIKTVPLTTHVCTRTELGLSDDANQEPSFFPI